MARHNPLHQAYASFTIDPVFDGGADITAGRGLTGGLDYTAGTGTDDDSNVDRNAFDRFSTGPDPQSQPDAVDTSDASTDSSSGTDDYADVDWNSVDPFSTGSDPTDAGSDPSSGATDDSGINWSNTDPFSNGLNDDFFPDDTSGESKGDDSSQDSGDDSQGRTEDLLGDLLKLLVALGLVASGAVAAIADLLMEMGAAVHGAASETLLSAELALYTAYRKLQT
jgi:hypothetical protein